MFWKVVICMVIISEQKHYNLHSGFKVKTEPGPQLVVIVTCEDYSLYTIKKDSSQYNRRRFSSKPISFYISQVRPCYWQWNDLQAYSNPKYIFFLNFSCSDKFQSKNNSLPTAKSNFKFRTNKQSLFWHVPTASFVFSLWDNTFSDLNKRNTDAQSRSKL